MRRSYAALKTALVGRLRECASAVMVGLVLDAEQAERIVRALEAVARALTLHGSDPGATKDEQRP